MTFVNPTNGYQKRFYNIRLWYFFFGIFYLIVHGLWGGNLWNPSYCVLTVSENTKAQIQRYIEEQSVVQGV